ncbi:MAG: hypothetical protein R2788_01710 [Saprospiraceae bacterium]
MDCWKRLFRSRFATGFFVVFAIIFPAFTGMTAGVGLSGDLKTRQIHPHGTLPVRLLA